MISKLLLDIVASLICATIFVSLATLIGSLYYAYYLAASYLLELFD